MGRLWGDETGVSSVIGTVLVLGITITVFGGLSVVVVSYFAERQETLRSDLAVQGSDGAYLLVHEGGEAVSLSVGRAWVNVAGNETLVQLSFFASQVGPDWGIGEALCLAGNDAGCRFPAGTDVRGVLVVVADSVVIDEGTRGTASA